MTEKDGDVLLKVDEGYAEFQGAILRWLPPEVFSEIAKGYRFSEGALAKVIQGVFEALDSVPDQEAASFTIDEEYLAFEIAVLRALPRVVDSRVVKESRDPNSPLAGAFRRAFEDLFLRTKAIS